MAYWWCRGPVSDVRRVLASLIEPTPEDSLPRARLLWVAAFGLTILLETLAWMAAERGAHERSAALLGCVERIREAGTLSLIDMYRVQRDHTVALTVAGLAQRAYDAAFERGRTMYIDEAVAFCRPREAAS